MSRTQPGRNIGSRRALGITLTAMLVFGGIAVAAQASVLDRCADGNPECTASGDDDTGTLAKVRKRLERRVRHWIERVDHANNGGRGRSGKTRQPTTDVESPSGIDEPALVLEFPENPEAGPTPELVLTLPPAPAPTPTPTVAPTPTVEATQQEAPAPPSAAPPATATPVPEATAPPAAPTARPTPPPATPTVAPTAPPPTPTTAPTSTPTATAPPAPPAATGRFATLPPGSALPSEAECAGRVRSAPEIRGQNAGANATRGNSAHDQYPRVTGNYTGTTDEIIQWAACKWGVDEDLVRAQMAVESWWRQSAAGDHTSNQAVCHPDLRTSSGQCPESIGLSQIKFQFHGGAYENNNAINSTAYNIDYAYSYWRRCFEGQLTWLNDVERGRQYSGGDALGCMGVWFSGRWYQSNSITYMERVQDYRNQRIWETSEFRNG